MRLFQRTLLSFAGVIVLEALLAVAAITAVVGSIQAEDAAREIRTEALGAFDAFNSWKLALWKSINELAEDEELDRVIAASPGLSPNSSAIDDPVLLTLLQERLSLSGAGSALLVDPKRGISRRLSIDPSDLGEPEAGSLVMRRPHPFIEILVAPGGSWFSGALRLAPLSGKGFDLYLLKRIDGRLLAQLSWDPLVSELLTEGSRVIRSDLAPQLRQGQSTEILRQGQSLEPSRLGRSAELPSRGQSSGITATEDHFLAHLAGLGEGNSWRYFPRLEGPAGYYSAVVQKTGLVYGPGGERDLSLIVILSLAEYGRRAQRVNEAVLAASLLAVLLTILVSLALSRSIAAPIRRLSHAMGRIGEGDFRPSLGVTPSGELGELLAGFKIMAARLESDRLELDTYIREIVALKDYREAIINAIREGLAVISAEGRVESANGSFAELFALDQSGVEGFSLAAGPRALLDVGSLERLAAVAAGREERASLARRLEDGRSFELKIYPLGHGGGGGGACLLVVEEITERLAYEERVIRAEKLSSIGLLSAGIAHEINNPLSAILSNVQNLIDEGGAGDQTEVLRLVERETRRIARIVRQLLDFSVSRGDRGGEGGVPPRCSPNEVARELVRLVGHSLRREGSPRLLLEEDPACPEAALSEDELKQILLNLLKNALRAVGSEGLVLVRTARVAEGILLSVADTGGGIAEEALGRIFDPFFGGRRGRAGGPVEGGLGAAQLSTEGEEGAGLGLSVVWGIVRGRGGRIEAANETGAAEERRGAVLRVYLPAAEEAE